MRILLAGASGVLGRSTLPHLRRHDVVGLTRTPAKAELVRDLGAEAAVCDVYDLATLLDVAQEARPEIVVNFLTDLAAGSAEANARIRREGGPNLQKAAEAAGARRLVIESVAFPLEGKAGAAVATLERSAQGFEGEAVILRFGLFWGPGTAHATPPEPPRINIRDAGAEAARLVTDADPGTHLVVSPS
jgi:nucleoside-diphosphate-sugar epimerase